jgi:hypothetical protein
VLRIDDDDQFVGLHLIHNIGGMLGKVLARLRAATTSATPLNKLTMSVTPNSENRIDHSPAALIAAMSAFIPNTMEDYAHHKADLVNTMGYDDNRIHGTVRLGPAAFEDMADGMLGLAPLSFISVELLERRFNLDLPLHPPLVDGTITFTPQPSSKGMLTLTDAEQANDLTFACDLVVPPYEFFEKGGKKLLVTWPMGRLVVSVEAGGRCDFSEQFSESELHPVAEWLVALRASEIIRGGNATIALKLPNGRLAISGKLTQEGPQRTNGRIVRLLEHLSELRLTAGAGDQPISLSTLRSQAKDISQTAALLQGNNTMTFAISRGDEYVVLENQDGLYINAVRLGEDQIYGIAVQMTLSFMCQDDQIFGTGAIHPNSGTIELLPGGSDEEYSRFISRTSRLTRHRLRIVGDLATEGAVEIAPSQ